MYVSGYTSGERGKIQSISRDTTTKPLPPEMGETLSSATSATQRTPLYNVTKRPEPPLGSDSQQKHKYNPVRHLVNGQRSHNPDNQNARSRTTAYHPRHPLQNITIASPQLAHEATTQEVNETTPENNPRYNVTKRPEPPLGSGSQQSHYLIPVRPLSCNETAKHHSTSATAKKVIPQWQLQATVQVNHFAQGRCKSAMLGEGGVQPIFEPGTALHM